MTMMIIIIKIKIIIIIIKIIIIIDIACSFDTRVVEKEQEKIAKYQDLKWELNRIWLDSCRGIHLLRSWMF